MEKITLRVCECDAYKDRTGSVMKAAATLGTTPRPPSMRTTAGQAWGMVAMFILCGSRLRVGGKAKGSEKDRHAHTCKAGRQAPAWMGQNLILLVEERMLDGCLDESTKARYQFKSP